jgi:transcriptional regulator
MVVMPSHLRSIVDRNGAVILDKSRNTMTTLDSTGAYIWERLQKGLQVDAIVAELVRDTGTDESVVAKDVDEFMEQLKSKHLVSLS